MSDFISVVMRKEDMKAYCDWVESRADFPLMPDDPAQVVYIEIKGALVMAEGNDG